MEIDAPIVAVTVYSDRARVTRRGAVRLEPGTHELQVVGLTLLLDADSVRVAGEGTAQVRILGVDVRHEYFTETPSMTASDLTRELQLKLDADQALQDELVLLDGQLKMLGSMSEHAGESLVRGIGRGRAEVADGSALLSFLSTQHGQFSARKRAIAIDRRNLSKEIQVLKQELERIQGARPRERYNAIVGVEAITGGDFALELEYTTRGGASWQPLYDLRLLEEGETPEIELAYLGQVQQSTGEDWTGVDLTLSTARPAISAELPELSPWYVNLYMPLPPPTAKRMARLRAAPAPGMGMTTGAALDDAASLDMEEEPPAPEPAMAQALEAQVDTSGTAVTFHIPRKVDIPAENTPHKVTVLMLKFEPELDFLTVPKLVDEVYRRAKVVNDSEVTLLPGPVSLYHGGEFLGRATLPKVAPREEFKTTLGIDDRIKVERELVLKEVGKQLIGDRRVRRYAYEIVVQNLLPHPATVVVGDQLPVAGHEDIRIKAEEIDPPPTSESEQGELTWKLELASQQKQTLRFEFTIAAPRSSQLVGLP
jgi:uncharacterized protein (TIGR02231 family)